MADLSDYDPIFQAAGQNWNIDPMLLQALVLQESNGDPQAVSKAGAMGLAQLTPDTARGLGVDNPLDPVESIWGAAKLMDQALNVEGGSVPKALLYYHGGPNWRSAYGKESRAYVPGVFSHYEALQKAAQATQQTQPPGTAQTAQAPATAQTAAP